MTDTLVLNTPRAWFAKFSSTISQHGFSGSSFDTTLFLRRSTHGITILLLYVDDMIITGDDMQGIQDLKHFLSHQFERKDLSPLNYFLLLHMVIILLMPRYFRSDFSSQYY